MPFEFFPLDIADVVVVEPRVFADQRGFFMEAYKRSAFAAVGIGETFVQENQSRSERGVLRGLHYQRPPHAQSKLVRVLSGAVFDVAVDLRPGSPTRGRWVGVTLSAENRKTIYIPPGCAHGFCVLTDHAEVIYHTSTEYVAEAEAGIMWNDPTIGIDWPIRNPIVSARDQTWPAMPAAGGE